MEKQEILDRVQEFAAKAHEGQVRKFSKENFIEHPVRVMKLCSEYTEKLTVLSAALLHDVLEDTEIPESEILDFLAGIMGPSQAKKTVHLVKELTDEYEKKHYPQWNRDKRKYMESQRLQKVSGDAQTIKYSDIIDNIPDIAKEDPDFSRKYLQEVGVLLEKLNKGNEKLRFRAKKVLGEHLKSGRGKKEVREEEGDRG